MKYRMLPCYILIIILLDGVDLIRIGIRVFMTNLVTIPRRLSINNQIESGVVRSVFARQNKRHYFDREF